MDERKMGYGRGDHRGVTLLEIVVGVAVVSVLAAGMSALIFSSIQFYRQGRVAAQMQLKAQQAADKIDQVIQSATHFLYFDEKNIGVAGREEKSIFAVAAGDLTLFGKTPHFLSGYDPFYTNGVKRPIGTRRRLAVIWKENAKQITLGEYWRFQLAITAGSSTGQTEYYGRYGQNGGELIADGVENFQIYQPISGERNHLIRYSFTLKDADSGYTYTVERQVSLPAEARLSLPPEGFYNNFLWKQYQ